MVMFFLSSSLQAEENKTDIIKEIELCEKECIDNNMSTAGMNNCLGNSADQYKKHMNITYNKLLKVLKGDAKESLIESQAAWENFFKNQSKFIGNFYPLQGTMYSTMRINDHSLLYKERLETLLYNLRFYESHKD